MALGEKKCNGGFFQSNKKRFQNLQFAADYILILNNLQTPLRAQTYEFKFVELSVRKGNFEYKSFCIFLT